MIEAIGPVDNGAAVRHWTFVLDDYERVLNSSEAAIEAGFRPATLQPPSFVPPAGVAPLPDDMRYRAQALVDRTQVLIERAQQVSVAERLNDPPRTRRVQAVSSSATNIDVRA